jgi:hypothetical protein
MLIDSYGAGFQSACYGIQLLRIPSPYGCTKSIRRGVRATNRFLYIFVFEHRSNWAKHFLLYKLSVITSVIEDFGRNEKAFGAWGICP